MDLRAALLLLLIASAFVAMTSAGDVTEWILAGLDGGNGGLVDHDDLQACDALLGECAGDEGEMGMASGIANRVLRAVSHRYISYGALDRNRVPCSRRGQSYYNCRPRARANPYRRGCSVITRCARIVH